MRNETWLGGRRAWTVEREEKGGRAKGVDFSLAFGPRPLGRIQTGVGLD